jgi:hypothetical protein
MHRTTENKQYIEQHENLGRVRAVPHLCGCYPGISLTTEEKARKNTSVRVAEGIHKHTMNIYIHTINT